MVAIYPELLPVGHSVRRGDDLYWLMAVSPEPNVIVQPPISMGLASQCSQRCNGEGGGRTNSQSCWTLTMRNLYHWKRSEDSDQFLLSLFGSMNTVSKGRFWGRRGTEGGWGEGVEGRQGE